MPKETKQSKLRRLNIIYQNNPRISNADLRRESGLGSRIVNSFLKNLP